MITSTRWKKLARDLNAISGRIFMMIAAIAVGVFAVTTILSAYTILTREISRNYLETNPVSAIIDIGAVDAESLSFVRSFPGISGAEAASIITARSELSADEWVRLLVFMSPDLAGQAIAKEFPEAGSYPPPDGTLALERESLKYYGLTLGDRLRVQMPGAEKTDIRIAATVHDPSLAPSWQEQTGYAYASPATVAALGGNPVPELINVTVADATFDLPKVEATVTALAKALEARGVHVHQMQIPPTGMHPHQSQMTTVLAMFLIFALLALGLSAILTASMIDGLLAQQVRQIAVMKAIGARARQVIGLYLAGILGIAAAAVAVGVPLGIFAGRGFADVIAELLNFSIASDRLSPEVYLGLVLGGLAIPALFSLVPILRATRRTVREALTDYGVATREFGDSWLDRVLAGLGGLDRTLVLAIRNTFRRRGRLILTLALLGAAGGMFVASLSVSNAWSYFVAQSSAERSYDLELQLTDYAPTDQVVSLASSIDGVAKVETWNHEMVAKARPDGLTLVRTYPDGGHASLTLNSMPSADSLAHLVMLDGRRPDPAERDEVLVNQTARVLLGNPVIGSTLTLDAEGEQAQFRLAGVVRQIVTLPSVYAQERGFGRLSGQRGMTNALRITTDDHSPDAIARIAAAVDDKLAENGIRLRLSLTETQLDSAVGGHVRILVVSLIVMSVLMAVVGLLGLASAQGTNVAERTREFGIMRTIGGTSRVVIRNVIAEGLFTGLVSIVVAFAIALPLAASIGSLVGTMSFGMALPLMISWMAVGLWLVFIAIGAIVASLVPSMGAARLTIRQTLAYN